jgi:hypothetical protein
MKCPKCGCEHTEDEPFCNLFHDVLKTGPAGSPPQAPSPQEEEKAPAAEEGATVLETLKRIRNGWVAAMVCGSITLIFVLLSGVVKEISQLVDNWALVDVALIFGMAFGIRAKSRTAATLMFVYYLGSKLYTWHSTGRLGGVYIAGVFIYYFYRAMMATFEYHRETANRAVPV